jgi:hypothetical protein
VVGDKETPSENYLFAINYDWGGGERRSTYLLSVTHYCAHLNANTSSGYVRRPAPTRATRQSKISDNLFVVTALPHLSSDTIECSGVLVRILEIPRSVPVSIRLTFRGTNMALPLCPIISHEH